MPGDAAGYAEKLYRVLHDLDGEGYDWIAIAPLPETPEWAGIRDRVQRAAHGS
jgi:L-threonylcarbamoyladenylate synthase